MEPVIVLNLKTYKESAGRAGENLCKIAQEVAEQTKTRIIVCPQTPELAVYARTLSIPVFAQHADAIEPGQWTGGVTWHTLKENGVRGSLINHSEHRLKLFEIAKNIEIARAMDMESLVCTTNSIESAAVTQLKPSYIAVEPPELIGSGISVSTAQPDIVKNTVKEVKRIANVPVLCGAGVSNGGDVRKAIELGAEGVLLASAYTKAKDPKALLMEMSYATK